MAWNIGTAHRVEVTMICDSTIDTLYMDPPGVTVKRLGLGHAFDPAMIGSKLPAARCWPGAAFPGRKQKKPRIKRMIRGSE